jgi:putative transposase
VASPGQNKKWVVYGALSFTTGQIIHDVRRTKSGVGFYDLVVRLVERAKRTGRKIVLVCDGPGFHKTKMMLAYLPTVARYLEIFWLPAYSPDLNLIERLWGHMKRRHIANVLYSSQFELHRAVVRVLRQLNQRQGSALEIVFRKTRAA